MGNVTRLVAGLAVSAAMAAGLLTVAPAAQASPHAPAAAAADVSVAERALLEALPAAPAPVLAVAAVAVPAAVTPGPSASASPKPVATTTYAWETVAGSRSKTGFIEFTHGSILYTTTPAADARDNWAGWTLVTRGAGGSTYPREPSGVCSNPDEGPVTYTTPDIPAMSACGMGTGAVTKCMLAHDGKDNSPATDWSYGVDWFEFVRYWQHTERLVKVVTTTLNGRVVSTVRTPTGPTRPVRDGESGDRRVQWKKCNFYGGPDLIEDTCPLEILGVQVRGPYGLGLPAYNSFNGNKIPQSVETNEPLRNADGSAWSASSPMWKNWNGGRLYGYGNNMASIGMMQACHDWDAPVPSGGPDFLGNWSVTKSMRYATCSYYRYGGYNTYNFQGCELAGTGTEASDYVVTCDKTNPSANYRVTAAAAPDMRRNFSPDAMECYQVTCAWTNPPESKLPLKTVGQGGGIPVVANEDYPDLVIRAGKSAGTIQVQANGSTYTARYPDLTIGVKAPSGAMPTSTPTKWTVFEVKGDASPWAPGVTDPNADVQPFQSRFRTKDGVLSQNQFNADTGAYCIPGLEDCLPREDLASIAGPNGVPVLTKKNGQYVWARSLLMNFYAASLMENPNFSVRAQFHQTWAERIAFPGIARLGPSARVTFTGRSGNFRVTATCVSDWTNYSVVKGRVVGYR